MKCRTFQRGMRALLFALLLPLSLAAFAQSTGWITTNDPVFNPTTAQAKAQGATTAATTMAQPVSITVVLKLNNQDLLNSYIAAQNTPGDPAYHQWLSSAQTTQNFSPTVAQAQAVADYLTASGFINVQIASDRLLVTATGTIAQAQQAFNTQIGAFSMTNGDSGIANTSVIQVPASLTQVDHVLGLNTLIRAHIRSLPASELKPLTGVPTAALGTGGTDGYYPDGFATVYDRPSNMTGRNTVAALIGWGDMTASVNDLQQFESARGIAAVPTSIVSTTGSSTDESGQSEWSMDAQAIVGISGGVKQLIFYTSGGSYNPTTGSSGAYSAALATAIDQALGNDTVKVINMSWSFPECNNNPLYSGLDSDFQIAVTHGQTFSASSGDNGSYPCSTTVNGLYPVNGTYGNTSQPSVDYPASSSYVIAVGGTTLTTGSNLAYGSESAWPYSGGGISAFVTKPSWQNILSGSYRQVPDLAFDADWNQSPIIMYMNGSMYYNGGTSLASPLFTGAWAVLESANNNALGFAPSLTIYPYATQWQASGMLHDVTSGSNGAYSAKAGYDNVTGWGSFDIAKLLGQNTTYTVTTSASPAGAGTFSPASAQVQSGGKTQFTITPNVGYAWYSINGSSGCSAGALAGATGPGPYTYTTGPITANCTFTMTFVPATYTVTSSAGTGGTISPSGAATVNYGTTKTYTLTPNTGYAVATPTGTCGGTLSGNTFTTKAITANCTVVAAFTPLTYTVTSSVSGTGGTISPSGAATVGYGATKAYTVTPSTGYTAVTPTGTCGGTLSGNTFTTKAITANCTVVAAFTSLIPTYTITAQTGPSGGTISPSGAVSVTSGTAKAFTVTPNSGYSIYSVGGNCGGGTLTGTGPSYTYTTSPITTSCTITANFVQTGIASTLNVTASVSGTGGTISPSGSVSVKTGANQVFTLTPSSGYAVSSVGGTCGGSRNGNTYTTNPITGGCTVVAVFTPSTTYYTVTSTATGPGTVTPASVQVQAGGTTAITLTANAGHSWSQISSAGTAATCTATKYSYPNATTTVLTVGPVYSNSCGFVVTFK